MMKNDFIIFTKEGLSELEIILESRSANLFWDKWHPRPPLPYDHLIKLKKERKDRFRDIGREIESTPLPEKLKIVNPALKSYFKEMKYAEKEASREK